jgi:16S rRNA (adenine1518-N6/adenine1519-N6)-dimethyltransferase
MIPESPAAVRETLDRIGLRPRKSLGQNFLADANLRDAIVRDSGVGEGELVLEVGPGLGILTKGLLDAGAEVVAAEKDERLVEFLAAELGGEPRLTLVPGDVLERRELSGAVAAALAGRGARGWRMVSNLPYSVSSPLLAAVARAVEPPDSVLVMVQREVALRMAGAPGTPDYGPLAVLRALRGHVRILREVGGRVFVPPPPVRSAIVEFTPGPASRDEILAGDRAARAAFLHRRKTIRRALVAAGHAAEAVESALSALAIDPRDRPEVLLPEQFVAIGERLRGSSAA